MIKTIKLINCQSWRDGSFSLESDKLNVIIAKNNTGKSVLIKMLKVSTSPKFFSAKKRKKLIRWGAQDARICYTFTDGSVAVVIVQPTKVIYCFKEADDEKFQASYDPPKQLIDELGMMVNSSGSFIANIIDTDQSLMLVDSESKATFEFIQMLCSNASLDEYRVTIAEWQTEAVSTLNTAEMNLMSVNYELQKLQYVDVGKEQRKLDELREIKKVMTVLIRGASILNNLVDHAAVSKDFDSLISLAQIVSRLESKNLKKLIKKSFNENNTEIAKCLELLEGIRLERVSMNSVPVPSETEQLVHLLEELERVSLNEVFIGKEPADVTMVDTLVLVERILDKVSKLATFKEQQKSMLTDIEKLKIDFLESGDVYECPIYGEVVYNGEECVHDHY